jgi:two-component system, NarL family, nitrate/nitrite response regulator NarL
VAISVYIAEDHPVFREAVARAVRARPDFELVGTAGDGATALEEIRASRPAVALLDWRLPALDGVEVVRAIASEALPTRMVMLSADASSSLVYEVLQLGVSGFLTKASTLAEICDALAAVARGETVLASEAQSGLVKELREREHRGRPVLTEREADVLRLIAEGLSGPQIGERLFISASTVKTHVKSILEKFGVSDRAAAVAEGMRRGVID